MRSALAVFEWIGTGELGDGTYRGRWLDEVARTPLISAEVKVLLLVMGRNMDEAGNYSVPRDELAEAVNCHPRKVTEKQKSAIDNGFLARTVTGCRGRTAEFQGRIPGVAAPERVPTVGTQSGERVPTTSTLSAGERVPTTSTLSGQRVPTVGTQSPGKGADSRPPTTYTPTDEADHGEAAVAARPSDDEKNSKASLRSNDRSAPRKRSAEPAGDPAFDRFWQTYPRRIAKPAARKAWAAAMKRGADPEQIILAAHLYATNPRRKESDPKYTAHPATWLNQERYDDEPDEPWTPPAPAPARSTTDERVAQIQALKAEMFGTPQPPLNLIRGELA